MIQMLEKVVDEIKGILSKAARGDHDSAYQMRDAMQQAYKLIPPEAMDKLSGRM